MRCYLDIILVCLVTRIFPFDAATSTERYKRYVNFKLKDSLVTGSYNHPSVSGCVAICGGSQNCVSVSWNPDTLQCIVSDTTIEHQRFLTINTDAISPWISYGKMTYDNIGRTNDTSNARSPDGNVHHVWHVFGPGRYSMTYLEAEAECAKERGRVARTTEVLAARAKGFSFCACSWMVDANNNRLNGFVIQVANANCWYTFNTGIIGCGYGRADAFCTDDL